VRRVAKTRDVCAEVLPRYILSTTNQYSIRSGLPDVEAEKLLRVALFSDTLTLGQDEQETLPMEDRSWHIVCEQAVDKSSCLSLSL
jgi:hypothetical protein